MDLSDDFPNKRIHDAEEIIQKATGSRLQSDTLLEYLERKYSKIYNF